MNSRSLHYDVLRELAVHAQSYLEVGVQEGGSLLAVVKSNPAIQRVVLCDTWDRRHGGTGRGSGSHIKEALSECGFMGDVEILDGKSQVTVPTIEGRFDLVHVDGGHDYEEVTADLRNCWLRTRKFMAVHDVTFPRVWQAICEFGRAANVEASVTFEDQGTAVFGRK